MTGKHRQPGPSWLGCAVPGLASLMAKVKDADAVCAGDSPSLTDTETAELPDPVGVPLIVSFPPAVLNDSPAGSPAGADQE
jgi:hypothetical protein